MKVKLVEREELADGFILTMSRTKRRDEEPSFLVQVISPQIGVAPECLYEGENKVKANAEFLTRLQEDMLDLF